MKKEHRCDNLSVKTGRRRAAVEKRIVVICIMILLLAVASLRIVSSTYENTHREQIDHEQEVLLPK